MLEELYQGLYDDGYFYGSFKQFQEKFKDLDYRKTLHAGIVNDGDFTGDFNTFENKFTGAATEVPSYNPETILSSSDYASPIDVAGYNIDAHTSLFNKGEGAAVRELQELYPGFNFEEVALGSKEGGGLDAIKISTKDGKNSATFDMNIGGLNLYGGAGLSEKEGRDRSFNILKDFVNQYSTDENFAAQDKAKKARRTTWENINTQRDEVAAEEIAKIQEDFESGELFKLKTDAKIGLMGNLEILIGGREAIPNVVVNSITPYKEEQKRALDDLKAEYKADGNKSAPTTEEVHKRALEYIIDGIQEKALTEVIERDELQGNITLPSQVGLQNKVINYTNDLFGDNKASLAEKYTIAAKEFDVDFNKDYNTLLAKALELDNGVEIIRFNEINSQLEDSDFEFDIIPGESVVTLQSGRQIPERIFNEFKGLNVKINNKVKAFKSFQEKVMEKAVQYSDNAAAIDIARRNYDGLEKFLTTTGLGFTEMYFNATIGMNLMGGGENKEAIDFLSDFKTSTSEIRDSYAKDVQFDDAFSSLTNFGTFVAQEVANQIPVFATLAIPGVGAATLGLSAFGEHYTDLSIERNSEGGRQLSNAEMWWMSAGFGASELVFESLTTIPLLRAAKRGFSATPGAKTLTDLTIGKYFKKNIGKTVYGIASEPIGEGMTQLTQNIIDGKPLTQGLAHAMFSGLMFGTTLSTAPFARGLYLSQFNDHSANIDYRERVDKIKNLNKTNLNIKINLKAGITGVGTQADIDVNNKAIADLQAENETHVREQETLVNSLSDDATKYYFALNSELEGIKNEAIEVDNNTTLTDQQKNDRLKQLQVKFDSKQRQKDFFRDKNAFGNEWDAYSGLDENADDVAALKKQAGDDLVNVNLEATKARRKEPTEIEVNQRAKFLYNLRKIKKDHAANSKAGLTDTKLFETNQDAITWVEKQTNISEATKAKFLNDIKDSNAHGANIKTQDGQVPFIIANNMAMDDRLETRTHEVGHSVFIKAIGANPAAFKDLSGQITEYLKQANPAAHKRLQFRLNQAGAIKDKLYDETIMVFLEEVASGKVDVAKSKQAGFLANLMNKGIEKVGGKKIDLRGETDAINFLIGIAKKIKAGTIDVSDIQAIKENRIAKQARKSAPKTKAEPTTKFSKTQTKTINDLGKQIVDEDGTVTDLEKEGQGNAYFQVEAENIWKQIQKQGLLDGLILAQPHEGVNDKTFLDTTYAELYSWFKKYQPERKNPSGLFGHINPQIPNRAKQAYNVITKGEIKYTQEIGETTKEGEVKVQVAAETDAAMEAFETEDLSFQGQAKKNKAKKQRYSQLRQEMGFKREVLDKGGNVVEEGDKIHKEVLESAKKSLIMAYGATQNIADIQLRAKAIVAKMKKEYASLNSPLFKQIKNFLTYGVADAYVKRGTKDIYISQLKKHREAIFENISTADLVQMERNTPEVDRIFTNFVKTLTSIEQVQDAVNKEQLPPEALNKITKDKKTGKGAFSPSLYDKIMPTPNELVSWADQPGINPVTGARQGLKGTRKDGIAMRISNSLITDATMEAEQSAEVQEKIADMGISPSSTAELAAAIGREVNLKFSKSNAIGDVTAAIDGAGDVSVYSQIKFSKAHRDVYEKQLTKRRPDLTEDQRKNAVQSVFDFVDGKEIPNNKKSKYEKMAMHYMANGYLILPEDGYKVVEAERLATQKKIDPFSFKNPNVLIETFVGEVKGTRTNPDKVKTFTDKTEFTSGVTVYKVEDSRQGQADTRKVIDTHFGKKSNPWCLAARMPVQSITRTIYGAQDVSAQEKMWEKQGWIVERKNSREDGKDKGRHEFDYKLTKKDATALDNAFVHWENYNEEGNGHQIAFQNGRLIAFRDGNGMQWWDRNDKPTDAPVVRGKKDKDGFKPVSLAYKNKSEVIHQEKVTGNKKNGTTIRKDLDGNLIFQETKKNGKADGLSILADNENKRSNDYNFKKTQNFKEGQRSDFKEERTYSNSKALEAVSFGRHEIRFDNITKYERSFTEKDWVVQTETTTIEGTVNQKYFEEFQDPSKLDGFEKTNLKYLTPTHQRYYDIQGKKVKIVKTTKHGEFKAYDGTGKTKEEVTVTIDGVKQEIISLFSDNDVKFSLTKLEINNKLDPYIIKMIEGSKNGVNPIAEYFYSSMQLQLSNGVKVDVAYDIAYNNTEKVHGIGFIARNDFESNVKNYYAPDIRKDAKKYAADYYKDQLKTVQTDKNTVNVDELNAINDYLINIGRPIRSAMVDYITSNENLLEDVYKQFGEKYRGHYHLVKAKPRGYKVEFSEKKNGEQQSINLYQEVTAIKKNPAKYEQIISKQSDLARKWLDNLLDSGMDKGKIKAILRLTSYGQRSPIRKLSKLGVYATTGIAKDLVLEHEITANDILAEITKHIDGKIKQRAQLNSFLNKAYVHVLPKGIDKFIKKYPGHVSNRNGKGYESMPLVENKIKELIEKKKLKGNTQLFKLSKSDNFQTIHKAVKLSRSTKKPTKGITVLDFDDTLATSKSLVKFTKPDGTKGTLNAEQYASTYESLLDLGYKFDFSEFTKVVDGKTAPLFNKAMKLQGKFGPKNMFVLTARPAESAVAIHAFLKANGLNIPLKNITGLANSTADAKALWMAEKVGEGYNDFYFADDALQNVKAVQNMLNQLDVKSKVQQARVKFSQNLDTEFNNILESITGIESEKRFSIIKGRKRGESKGKFRFFIPPSHEDFVGLLYNFMGKGKEGNAHRDFLEKALVRPLNRGYREIDSAKQAIANDYKSLNKQFPEVKDKLAKNTPDGDFTFQDAIRVYLWDKHGHKIPGLTETDQKKLAELVMSDPQLQTYAETLNIISKQENYVAPGQAWETANIRIDLVDATGRVGRVDYFTEFNENAGEMFSEENLNKIEAAYGRDFREALEDMLHRIKTGVNRPKGSSGKPNMFMNWLNASVSGVMFFNTRSALLQQLSNVNFLNFADNNIFAAGKAFANQPQYWKDFAMIFNSDMLKQRRGGIGTDINGAELAESIKKARPDNMFDQVAIITGKALKLGFLPTQIGDNIAIATGGAAFYRNRVNKYLKDGLSVKEAETKAFTDLQNITQSTQQSARPDMTSQQQASWIGKLVLNFLNTPSQYNRIIKKAGSDIKNRRITPPNTTQMQSDMSNASRMLYYGAAQNLIFYSLQTALFAVMFDDDDEESEALLKKKERVINGSIDTILRGSGIYGVAISTLKNMTIKFLEQREKGYNKDESAVIMEMLNFSPVVGIKARKIVNAEKTLNYNKKVIDEMETFDIDNPQWSAVTNYVESITTAPVNRIYQKTLNLRNAADNNYTALQRALFFSGYTTWSLDLGDTEKMEKIKADIKNKKKKEKKGKKKKPLTREQIRIKNRNKSRRKIK